MAFPGQDTLSVTFETILEALDKHMAIAHDHLLARLNDQWAAQEERLGASFQAKMDVSADRLVSRICADMKRATNASEKRTAMQHAVLVDRLTLMERKLEQISRRFEGRGPHTLKCPDVLIFIFLVLDNEEATQRVTCPSVTGQQPAIWSLRGETEEPLPFMDVPFSTYKSYHWAHSLG